MPPLLGTVRTLCNFKYIIFVLVFCCLFSMLFSKKAVAYDTKADWQEGTSFSDCDDKSSLAKVICVITDIVKLLGQCFISQIQYFGIDYDNSCIPSTMPPDKDTYCNGSKGADGPVIAKVLASIIDAIMDNAWLIIVAIAAIAVLSIIPGINLIIYTIIGRDLLMILNLCTNSYIIAPHEYVNEKEKRHCKCTAATGTEKSKVIKDKDLDKRCVTDKDGYCDTKYCKFTSLELPFFYKCKRGEYGDMGDLYCKNPDLLKVAETYGDMVGSLTIGRRSFWSAIGLSSSSDVVKTLSRDDIKGGRVVNVVGDNWTLEPNAEIAGYYRLNSGKVQLCAGVTNMWLFSFLVGCTYVPPPSEKIYSHNTSFVDKTRCRYFRDSRTDLKSLGVALGNLTENGSYASVPRFLQSDMHITSTVVGCIEDLLVQVMVAPDDTTQTKSVLHTAQMAMKQIVMAVLTLYICLVGLKIMTSANPPSMKESVVYIVKLVLVLYLGLGNIWYSPINKAEKSDKLGLYPVLMSTMETIAGLFMQATDYSDPIRMCYYPQGTSSGDETSNNLLLSKYADSNALKISGTLLDNTSSPYNLDHNENNPKVMLSVWDYIDCRLVNYWNLNSCNYGISGFIAFWFIGTAMLFSGPMGFMLAILSFIYVVLLSSIIFTFVHITILCIFTVTLLVLVAPIMVCFLLFEQTKGIFDNWAKAILGYTLYPGLLFAFVALILVTIDSMFYGDPKILHDLIKQNCHNYSCDYNVICKDPTMAASMYCGIMKTIGDKKSLNNCSVTLSKMVDSMTTNFSIPLIGNFTVLINDVTTTFYPLMLRVALCVLVFYLFTSSMIQFVEGLVGVHSSLSKGAEIDVWKHVKRSGKIAATIAMAPVKGAAKLAAKLKGKGGGETGKK
ncbi:type IV secretion system protein VirB6 [Alphaproteobacteria bacterium]